MSQYSERDDPLDRIRRLIATVTDVARSPVERETAARELAGLEFSDLLQLKEDAVWREFLAVLEERDEESDAPAQPAAPRPPPPPRPRLTMAQLATAADLRTLVTDSWQMPLPLPPMLPCSEAPLRERVALCAMAVPADDEIRSEHEARLAAWTALEPLLVITLLDERGDEGRRFLSALLHEAIEENAAMGVPHRLARWLEKHVFEDPLLADWFFGAAAEVEEVLRRTDVAHLDTEAMTALVMDLKVRIALRARDAELMDIRPVMATELFAGVHVYRCTVRADVALIRLSARGRDEEVRQVLERLDKQRLLRSETALIAISTRLSEELLDRYGNREREAVRFVEAMRRRQPLGDNGLLMSIQQPNLWARGEPH
jgi:hypothetical protein